MKKKGSTGSYLKPGIGVPTVILLLTVLGLAIFGSLTVKAAYTELKLTRNSIDAVASYYGADAQMEEQIFTINNLIYSKNAEPADEAALSSAITACEGVYDLSPERLILRTEIRAGYYLETVIENWTDGISQSDIISHKAVITGSEVYEDPGFEIDSGFSIIGE